MRDPVTQAFLERVKTTEEDEDKHVHLHLSKNELSEAAVANAGVAVYKEILDMPHQMIEDAREEEEINSEA